MAERHNASIYVLCLDSSQIRSLIQRVYSPTHDQLVKPSDFGYFKLLIYDRDTEGKQLGEIKRKNIPATFWRTKRIWSPDLSKLFGRNKELTCIDMITDELSTGLMEV